MLKKSLALLLVTGSAGWLTGCGGDATEPPERIVTTLECTPGGSAEFNCAMVLSESTGFSVTLQDSDCTAHGNTVRLLEPQAQILTTDGCYATKGSTWAFDGPFPAGTAVTMEIVSAKLANPPGVEIAGEYPSWTVNFEDGDDADFNDLVLAISATP